MSDRDIPIRLSAAEVELARTALVGHARAQRDYDAERDAYALADLFREALDVDRAEWEQARSRGPGRRRRRSGLGSATRSAD